MRKRLLWTIKDSYDDYVTGLKEDLGEDDKVEDHPFYIEYSNYKEFFTVFFEEIGKAIIREKMIFKIPYRMGYISIRKKKTKFDRRLPNFKVFNETGKIVSHSNIHTNGYYFYFEWDKTSSYYTRFRNQSYYRFDVNRGNDRVIGARGLSEWIFKCANDPTMKGYDAPFSIKYNNNNYG